MKIQNFLKVQLFVYFYLFVYFSLETTLLRATGHLENFPSCFLNLPLLFNASDNPRDENTIKVGAKRHIANILRTKDVVTLEKNESLNQFNTEIVLTAKHPTCKWLSC